MANRKIRVTVNGTAHEAEVEPRLLLVHFLREDLRLTGTHIGCELGQCGACTVLIDGVSARACLILAARLGGQEVTTVEGLGDPAVLSPLQQGCLERHSFQCGFCAPGILMAATELLAENPDPSEAEVRQALRGNLCRCTGYDSIIAGIVRGAELLRRR